MRLNTGRTASERRRSRTSASVLPASTASRASEKPMALSWRKAPGGRGRARALPLGPRARPRAPAPAPERGEARIREARGLELAEGARRPGQAVGLHLGFQVHDVLELLPGAGAGPRGGVGVV